MGFTFFEVNKDKYQDLRLLTIVGEHARKGQNRLPEKGSFPGAYLKEITKNKSIATMVAFNPYKNTTGEKSRQKWEQIPEMYPVKMITRNTGLFPPAERLRKLLAMAKGQALPKQPNINASKNSTHISSLLFYISIWESKRI